MSTLLLTLSHWARHHPIQARLIITASHILLPFLAFDIGSRLYAYELGVPAYAFYPLVGLFTLAILEFPSRAHSTKTAKGALYARRLFSHGLILVLGMLICMSGVSLLLSEPAPLRSPVATAVFTAQQPRAVAAALKQASENTKPANFAQAIRQVLKQRVTAKQKRLTQDGDGNGGYNMLAIFLVGLASFLLGLLVLALSCSVACNGYGFLALIIGIAGLAGLVALNAFILKMVRPALPPGKRILFGILAPVIILGITLLFL